MREHSTAEEFQWHSPSNRAPVPSAARSSKKDQKAVATHRMRAHGHRKPVSSYIESDCLQCPGCNKHFPSRSKLLDHAQYRSKGCRDKILLSQP